jgi:hypothetical protein
MPQLVWLIVFCTVFFSPFLAATPLTNDQVPEPLKPWITWALPDKPQPPCPFLYHSFEQKHCSWATATRLDLNAHQGDFNSVGQVYNDSWISLPGDSNHWPQQVTLNNKPALVMDKDGVPSIKLTAATAPVGYQIHGVFFWDKIPDNLLLPADTGLLNVSINGVALPAPTFNDGTLWLKASDIGQQPEQLENYLDIQVFRKITDDVPMQVTTHLVLDVAGEQREIKLPKPLLTDFVPLSLSSPLPARLEADGQLLVQVRPGRWEIDIAARLSQALQNLPLTTTPDWPATEIWVFDARPDLRIVEIEQLQAIDTSQSNLPEAWRGYPAYSISQGQAMGFKVIRRGDPEPEPNQLQLARTLWLDFDGHGYTANDQINGQMSQDWRLNALPATQLGKVTLNGGNQLITTQPDTRQQGVEVRQGTVTLSADSRLIGATNTLSAVGWAQRFQKVTAELNLPPGWRLLATSGVDNVPDSWLTRWTLLDLFLVLFTAGVTANLWHKAWGVFALVTLILSWHEPDAPHFIWLAILATTALCQHLPAGKMLDLIRACRSLSGLVLILITLPFMVDQVRTGLYPQLERVQIAAPVYTPAAPEQAGIAQPPDALNAPFSSPERALSKAKEYAYDVAEAVADKSAPAVNFERIDPTAKVQTGPGLPQWQWHKVQLSWNGPVDAAQTVRLWYLSPPVTMLLNVSRALFIAVLALLMLGVANNILKPKTIKTITPLWAAFLLLPPLLATPSQNVRADYPSEAMLAELKNRLQAVVVPDCLPACAQIQSMHIDINAQTLDITLQIDAQEAVALPLPSANGQWFPHQVTDNGAANVALYRESGGLWMGLNAGKHAVVLRGAVPLLSQFTLPLPLKPMRVTIEKTAWDVAGLQENGVADGQLQFTRSTQNQADNNPPTLEAGALPAFFSVKRTLQLGLDWRVTTQITRVSPPDSAVVLNVPLLAGEAVTSAGVRVKNGQVEANFAATQDTLQWQSTLEKSAPLNLTATTNKQWLEVWAADVSPIWHLQTTGIAVMHLSNPQQWLPEWHPWPGETLVLTITRPEAVAGQTLTIDHSHLSVTTGQRNADVQLAFNLRSSQGGQHTLVLPEHAVLQTVTIDGQSQPLRPQGRKLALPVHPGEQSVAVNWQENTGITTRLTTPDVDLGVASVNTGLQVNLGADRWVLFVCGPRLGPAVLFWGVLLVIVMLALGLAKIPLTPLKHWQWFLLLVGLSQVPLEIAGLVIVWLMLLGWRQQQSPALRHFNGLQSLLVALTVLALGVLFFAVEQGLLGSPDMGITGNQSTALNLNWYQDRSAAVLPTATVISVPVLVYRLLMLGWSLWLAVALLDWLKWGWGCFSHNGLWHKRVVVEKPAPSQAESQ